MAMVHGEPVLRACFSLDKRGAPVAAQPGRRTRYSVDLWIENAPEGTKSVTYVLHPTFLEPVREVLPSDNVGSQKPTFRITIMSYGDFDVVARIRAHGEVTTVTRNLASALKDSYRDEKNEAVRSALLNIERY